MGRPNVGKSALFNRITESGASIVYDYPGVTRDCIYSRAEWGTSEFLMIDTGGLMNTSEKLPASLSPVDIRGLQDSGLPEVRPVLSGVEPAAEAVAVHAAACPEAMRPMLMFVLRRCTKLAQVCAANNGCSCMVACWQRPLYSEMDVSRPSCVVVPPRVFKQQLHASSLLLACTSAPL